MREYTADELLASREARVNRIKKLIEHYNTPLLVMRVNYPGLKKMNDLTLKIIQDMSALIYKIFGEKICFKSLQQGAEGPVFMAAVAEDVIALKRAAINLEEEHVLGRCLDVDVYDSLGKGISRLELGFFRRKCYLCEDYAQHCVRARRHSEREVIDYIESKFREYRNLGTLSEI
ncbi:citrate lyase holo-[acyl-carrier protein] synthase [Desulfosporosinus sp. SB140]|uniref:citrate lyase holo-[acyl-carrier protein] synthase n=1 Tax=Desulfosporosinus paludis TaxID=3115649 RepID=UPI00388D32BC